MARKVIGLLSAAPDSVYAARLIEGVSARCQEYGYDVAVFSPLAQLGNSHKKYLEGEKNIYHLVNTELLDGLVLDMPSLMDNETQKLIPHAEEALAACKKPVAICGGKVPGYPSFTPSNNGVMEQIVDHVIEKHGCRSLYFLGGPEDNVDTIDRLQGFRKSLTSHGIPCEENQIFHGDFWYSGGARLADRILSHEIPQPDAVICASDHMAIGLVNRLTECGIHVPEDVIVTGFDATQDAAVNQVTITSIPADTASMAIEAVDYLREVMEPGAEIFPMPGKNRQDITLGMSCGCNLNLVLFMEQFRPALYSLNHDFGSSNVAVDIGMLSESNMLEYLSDSKTPQECLQHIYHHTYLLGEYSEFYLCLDENWLNADLCCQTGYPKHIQMAVNNTPELGSGHYYQGYVYDTADMLPDLRSESREPSLFYFMPVHFLDEAMGYAVLRYAHTIPHKMNCVIRNWLKNVSTGLHISRTTHRLASLSTRDGMTGAYNRRGMELMLDTMLRNASPSDSVLAFVIDMDRLKTINDTYGHAEGDEGIHAIASAAMAVTEENELCVRAGGDEFYIVGIGSYSTHEAEQRIRRFHQQLNEINAKHDRPYTLSASIGSACIPLSSGMTVMGIIRIADAKMYESKAQKKLQRKE